MVIMSLGLVSNDEEICIESHEKEFITKIIGEMKSQFNKAEGNLETAENKTDEMSEIVSESSSTKSSQHDSEESLKIEKSEPSTNEVHESLLQEERNSPNKFENLMETSDQEDKPRIVMLFKKPNNESVVSKDLPPGRRSLRNKSHSIDEQINEATVKRSSRRRSKDSNESVLQSAIARKEKSYNESNKPQRLTRQLKPTPKILENLAYAKQEKNKTEKIKSPKSNDKSKLYDSDSNNDSHFSGDSNSNHEGSLTPKKQNHKQIRYVKRKTKRLRTSNSTDTSKETDSDQSESLDTETDSTINTRRSQRISSSRQRDDMEDFQNEIIEPSIANHPDDLEESDCMSVSAQLIKSRLCLCTQKTQFYVSSDDEVVYCTAVDSVGEKLVGCSRVVNEKDSSMLRPSKRVPYTILCDLHRNRMIRHNCCPTCGIFCTQGRFVECEAKHHYHRDCQISVGDIDCCPHCGSITPDYDVYITMHSSQKPIFLPFQKTQ